MIKFIYSRTTISNYFRFVGLNTVVRAVPYILSFSSSVQIQLSSGDMGYSEYPMSTERGKSLFILSLGSILWSLFFKIMGTCISSHIWLVVAQKLDIINRFIDQGITLRLIKRPSRPIFLLFSSFLYFFNKYFQHNITLECRGKTLFWGGGYWYQPAQAQTREKLLVQKHL